MPNDTRGENAELALVRATGRWVGLDYVISVWTIYEDQGYAAYCFGRVHKTKGFMMAERQQRQRLRALRNNRDIARFTVQGRATGKQWAIPFNKHTPPMDDG
jgi:hypothetical protein